MHEERFIPARPRKPEEIVGMSNCPEILGEATNRGITQIVHFTTMRGAVGILASNSVKSRARLSEDSYLEMVYQPNAEVRKDPAWLDYVNLSVERINEWMFQASTRWHRREGNPWIVLSFHPRILTHPGVVFTTTNNIYPRCRRSEGLAGFREMFAEIVYGRYSEVHDRSGKEEAWPTDRQGEVLYPGVLSCEYLQRIDVQLEHSLEDIDGLLGALSTNVPVCHAPEVFQ